MAIDTGQLDKNTSPQTGHTGRKKILIYVSAFFIFIILAAFIFLAFFINSNTIYKGVQVSGTDVHGLSKGELSSLLEERFATYLSDLSLNLESNLYKKTVASSELNIKIDINVMTEAAHSYGRKGNFLERLTQIIKLRNHPVSVDLMLDTETEEFNTFIDNVCIDVFRDIVPSNIIIMDDQVILCTGIQGRQADREQLKNEILAKIKANDSSAIQIPILIMPPPLLDIESILAALNTDPVNAEMIKTSRTEYEIIPHKMGMRLDRIKLMEIVSYVEGRENKDYEEILLPVEFIAPTVTEEQLKASLFKDVLASFSTHFNTEGENNYNRSINIGLAARSIDGTLLLPGEIFSFNDVVGPRTVQKGYRTAHIFVEGRIADGTGGGICQVSTTLYNAVLRANLEVIERHNHMFTVGYVPLGHDAAVSYGYADLVFKNTTPYPLRINAAVSPQNNVSFIISSFNDYPNIRVKLATKTISTTPVQDQITDDISLHEGAFLVDEEGMAGYVIDTYIKVYNGDALIREELLHRSVYQMYPRKIRRGTAPYAQIIELPR